MIGKSLKQAAELALFERDNPNLQLIVKDDKGTPDGARAAAEDALKSGATLILGPVFAKSVAAVAPVARKAGVPVIAFSNDRQVAGSGVYLLSFQPAPEVERVVAYAASRGKRRYAALISQDAFGKIVEPAFRDAVSRNGGTVVALETYNPGSANAMLEPLRKISAAIVAADAEGGPVDALFVPGGQEQLEALGRLLPQAQINTQQVKLIGTGGMDYPNAGRDSGLVGAWYPGPDPRGWTDFAQRYAKSYGHVPPRIASLAYDAVALAIALAGGPEGQRYTSATVTRAWRFHRHRRWLSSAGRRHGGPVARHPGSATDSGPRSSKQHRAHRSPRPLRCRARISVSSTSSISSFTCRSCGLEALRQPQHDLVEHHAARCRGAQAICSEPLDQAAARRARRWRGVRDSSRFELRAGSGRCPQ